MDLDEFIYELEHFIESREFLTKDDGDTDEYRKGYRSGYWDALNYIKDWAEEEAES